MLFLLSFFVLWISGLGILLHASFRGPFFEKKFQICYNSIPKPKNGYWKHIFYLYLKGDSSMKKNHSTKDDGFVSIPSPVSPNGKVDIKNMKLTALVTSKNFTVQEKINEINHRHPENTFLSLMEWTEAMELTLQLYPKEEIFCYKHEREVVLVILRLVPTTPRDLAIFRQILKNDWLAHGIKAAVKERLEKLNR
jgi:hypothetical protein